jgi:hypothetical protein
MKKATGKPMAAIPPRYMAGMTARNDRRVGDVKAVLTELESLGSKRVREDMGKRFGIHTDKAWGVRMADMQKVSKAIGTDHATGAATLEDRLVRSAHGGHDDRRPDAGDPEGDGCLVQGF